MHLRFAAVVTALGLAAVACGSAASPSTGSTSHTVLRLGYFPNLTHASAIAGLKEGIFSKDLGNSVTLQTQTFTSGGPEAEALLDGSLDAGYIGPSTVLAAFSTSHGAITVISGATSGGAELVTKTSITSAAQLKGSTIATPQLGNTQDVALRYYLSQHGLSAPAGGGGDVTVLPETNATTLESFETGAIDGAWVPEPWASEMVLQGHGHVLVDERSLWPQGQFATTVLVVRTAYLKADPTVVADLVKGQIDSNAWLLANPSKAQSVVNQSIDAITGGSLPSDVVAKAWSEMSFTNNPVASSFATDAKHADAVGFSVSTKLTGLFDLGPLNSELALGGKPTVAPTGS